MQNPDKQGEQSMEEILASIRKIISEDPQATPAAAPAVPTAVAAPAATAVPPGGDLSDILEDVVASTSSSVSTGASEVEVNAFARNEPHSQPDAGDERDALSPARLGSC